MVHGYSRSSKTLNRSFFASPTPPRKSRAAATASLPSAASADLAAGLASQGPPCAVVASICTAPGLRSDCELPPALASAYRPVAYLPPDAEPQGEAA